MDFSFKTETLYSLNKDGSFQVWQGFSGEDSYQVKYGKEDGKMQTRNTKCKGKNAGKANATSDKEQAQKELVSKFNKQIDKGYRLTKEEAVKASTLLPMLAHDYLKKSHKINYPCFASRKLDGVRAFCTVNLERGTVTFTSRMGKEYIHLPHLFVQMRRITKLTGITKFDGELYIHGQPLQDIVGAAKKFKELSRNLQFHIFDLPDIPREFEQRNLHLQALQDTLSHNRITHVTTVENVEVKDEEEARKVMLSYMNEGYEGLMLRNKSGMYEFGNRSNDLQKWKDFKDMEVKAISVREDKNGEGVYLCEMKNGKRVECKMVGSFATRRYDVCVKNIGRWITLKYQALTKDGIPQFPVGIAFRECDEKGNPLV